MLEATPDEVPVKVILETSLLSDYELRRGAELVIAAGGNFIKTGTGWAGPTTLEAVQAIRDTAGDEVELKVAGGVHSLDRVRAMRSLGVTRFGINLVVAVELVEEQRRAAPTVAP